MAKIIMITPAARGRSGNAVTAARWARRLGELGHRVAVREAYAGEPCDLLVALHARKSAAAVRRFRRLFPDRPVVVVLTGTDLYQDLGRSAVARRSLALADRVVVLQPLARRELPASVRPRTVVVYQSATAARAARAARGDVLVLAHLRSVKDPLRVAYAARFLPPDSRLHVVHAGRATTPAWARRARTEMHRNPRYVWRGEVSPAAARRLLARATVLVVSSRLEGGANVVSEAAVAGVPVLASRIPGNVGLLGGAYPGYFPAGDTRALARLLDRVERDATFLPRLRRGVRRAAHRFGVRRERAAWRRLLDSLLPGVATRRARA